jgi:hypothetical protein
MTDGDWIGWRLVCGVAWIVAWIVVNDWWATRRGK